MIKQFAGASIWSEDLNNLLPFYRDVLGIKVTMESPGFVLLAGLRLIPRIGIGHPQRGAWCRSRPGAMYGRLHQRRCQSRLATLEGGRGRVR